MNVNLLEGVHDKTTAGLREIVLAQARVRLFVAVPVILSNFVVFFATHGAMPLHPFSSSRAPTIPHCSMC
jgi:hypothetical protein